MGYFSALQEPGIFHLSECLNVHAAPSVFYSYSLIDTLFILPVWQIFTDFQEVRREIEAETERTSGDNKVKKTALI